MIIYRQKEFKSSEERDNDKIEAVGTGLGSAAILSNIKTGRLTGKVTRYHNTDVNNVEKILKEGLRSKYAEDPNNITNRVTPDIDMSKKKGLVYTAKKKRTADGVGLAREMSKRPFGGLFGPTLDDIIEAKKNNKTLKLEFDYDAIKDLEKIINPELRGAKTAKELQEIMKKRGHPMNYLDAKAMFDSLSDKGTHIFRGDIDPSHIVGGKGYKKRSLKQVGNYIKNNPKRFGKEAMKVGVGVGLGAYAGKKAYDAYKEEKSRKK